MLLLMAAGCAVGIFMLGFGTGRTTGSSQKGQVKELKTQVAEQRLELDKKDRTNDILSTSLRIIKNGAAAPELEADLALSNVNEILYKEIN